MNVRRMPMSNLNDIFFTPAANQELTYDQILEDVQRYFAENHASMPPPLPKLGKAMQSVPQAC